MYPRILVVPGSVRSGSLNVRLARVMSLELAVLGADVTQISLEDYPLPLIDFDPAADGAVPDNARRLAAQVSAHDGVLLCCPEHNASLPPRVKNTIDWIGLVRGGPGQPSSAPAASPWSGRNVALSSVSDREEGGGRVVAHLQEIMRELGARPVPQGLAIAAPDGGFDEDGRIIDTAVAGDVKQLCRALYEQCGGL